MQTHNKRTQKFKSAYNRVIKEICLRWDGYYWVETPGSHVEEEIMDSDNKYQLIITEGGGEVFRSHWGHEIKIK